MFDPFCKIDYNNKARLFMDDNKSLAICDLSNVDVHENDISENIHSNCYFFDYLITER